MKIEIGSVLELDAALEEITRESNYLPEFLLTPAIAARHGLAYDLRACIKRWVEQEREEEQNAVPPESWDRHAGKPENELRALAGDR